MNRLARFLKRFLGNARGAAAIEFALILPVMVTMLTGLIELSYLMMAERRVSNAAHSTANLIAQETDVTSSDLTDIFSAASLIMAPFSTSTLKIGVSSVRFDDTTGAPSQDWSSSYNAGSVTNPTTLATNMGEAGSSVIIVTTSYSYTPIMSAILTGPFALSETAIVRPRYLDYVGYY
jgi:Flp pilus assembly protein TadG